MFPGLKKCCSVSRIKGPLMDCTASYTDAVNRKWRENGLEARGLLIVLESSQVIKTKQCEANSVCAANVIFIISFPIIFFVVVVVFFTFCI